MSERQRIAATHKLCRTRLCKAVCALLLAATAAACDKCGDFVPPIRLHGDVQLDACRDEAPRPR